MGRKQGKVSLISWMGSGVSIQYGACVWGMGQKGGPLKHPEGKNDLNHFACV